MAGNHINLLVHFVWSTAGREPWISSAWEKELYKVIGGILRNKNAKLLEAGSVSDHIHLFTSLPSTVSLAEMANVIKSNSSRCVHQKIPRCAAFAWQEGY